MTFTADTEKERASDMALISKIGGTILVVGMILAVWKDETYLAKSQRFSRDSHEIESTEQLGKERVMEDNKFVTVAKEYLMELEQKAKDSEYFRGRVDGMEYVIDSFENAFKERSSDE